MNLDSTTVKSDELAALFITTVQGDFSPESCIVLNGALVRSDKPIARAAKPDLALLAQLLGSSAQLPEQIETWLIELFNQQGTSACRAKEIRRRAAGRPWHPRFETWFDSLPAETLEIASSTKSSLRDAGYPNDFCALHISIKNSRPLSPGQRAWFTDIFDPNSLFDFQVRTIVRRVRGAKPIGLNPSWFGWEAACKVEELLEETFWEAAIAQIAKEYGKSASYVQSAVQFRRIAKKVGAFVP